MRVSLLGILLLLSTVASAQNDSVRLVKYQPDFRFTDGLYLGFEQVKNNNPISPMRIISSDDPFDFNFFRNLVKNDAISYYDSFGARHDVQTSEIWGFCQDGKLFIQYNREFNRIPIIGTIGHFIADVTVTSVNYDPYYYNDYYDYYYNPYMHRPYNRTTRTREMRQYLIDFVSGQVLEFDLDAVKSVLINDEELYSEFNGLKKRQQKELMFFYIRRFNEKNPLYIPVR